MGVETNIFGHSTSSGTYFRLLVFTGYLFRSVTNQTYYQRMYHEHILSVLFGVCLSLPFKMLLCFIICIQN
jgi:hypothetical protein